MTDVQIFQFFGVTFVAIAIGMMTNPEFIKGMAKDFLGSTANVFFGGLACLAIGFPLIALHNDWTPGPGLIITWLGWISVAKGLYILMIPRTAVTMYKLIMIKENKFVLTTTMLAFGIFLLYLGYIA